MLKATIYQLPHSLRHLDGRSIAVAVARQVVQGGQWQLYRPDDCRIVSAGARRQGDRFPAGTGIVRVFADVRAGRVMLQHRVEKGESGESRGSIPDISERIELVRQVADAAGLVEPPAGSLPVPATSGNPVQVMCASGPCEPRRVARTVIDHGFVHGLEGRLQLVVIGGDSTAAGAPGLLEALHSRSRGGGAMPRGVDVYRQVMTPADAASRLANPGHHSSRGNTVLIFTLPDIDLGADSPELQDLASLQGFDVPVITARASQRNEYALAGIIYKAMLARSARPYSVDHDFMVDALVGVDAAHGQEDGTSRWSAVLLDAAGKLLDYHSREGRRDESYKSGVAIAALEAVVRSAVSRGCRRILIHRDGRRHDADWPQVNALARRYGVAVEFVPVAKTVNLMLYREDSGWISPPRFGDALVERDGSGAWVFTAYGPKAADANALYVGGLHEVEMGKALRDLLGAALLPTPGLFSSTRLPATTYWADMLSKRDVGTQLMRSGFMDERRRSTPAAAQPPAP